MIGMLKKIAICWIAIFVAVDVLVTTLLACWAIDVAPKGWWSISPLETLTAVVVAYVAVVGVMMIAGCLVKAMVLAIVDKARILRGMYINRYYSVYVPVYYSAPTCQCGDPVPEVKTEEDSDEDECQCDECKADRKMNE
jgi:hypothetical protein